MKTLLTTLGLTVMLALAIFAGTARAQDATDQGDGSVSFQTFYDQLAGQGTWIQTSQYGNVWQPNESDPNWRPYTYGHWVNTDQGMTWVSDESFGWATYHYGRWTNLDGYGWVWVPGYTWAPAWVSWRDGDDEVGWAPLPPASDQGIDYYADDDYYTGANIGFHIGDDCDVAYGIGPAWYNFCPIVYIGDRDCWRHYRNYHDNFAFIGHTRNVTNINFRRDGAGRFGHVRAEGPSVAALNARSHNRIENAQLASVSRPGDAGLRGNRLGVFAPRVDASTFRTARPAHVGGTIANARVNRGTDIQQPLAVNSHVRSSDPTADQVRAATLAQGTTPNSARVATPNTHFSRSLNQPLTSLHAGTRATDQFGAVTRTQSATQPRTFAPATTGDSRYTGQGIPRSTFSSNRESPLTGDAGARHFAATPCAGNQSRYTGEGFRSQAATPVFHNNAQAFTPNGGYHRSSTFSSAPSAQQTPRSFGQGAPVYRSNAPVMPAQPTFHAAAPVFHSSAPAVHPQQSFHAMAPAPASHFNGGGNFGGGAPHISAPAGGGHAGGGGGAVHASAGPAGGGHR